MLQTLRRVEQHVPDVLASPDGCDGKRVMEAAMSASLNPKIPRALRTASLELLQRRIATVDPDTPQRIFALQEQKQSPIAADFGDGVAVLAGFERALRRYLGHRGRGRPPTTPLAAESSERALTALGILEALLVTRLGYCDAALLNRVVEAIGEAPLIAPPWAWVDIHQVRSQGPSQLRRVFLDPVTLAAWLAAHRLREQLPAPNAGAKAGQRGRFASGVAAQAFRTLAVDMQRVGIAVAIPSLRRLCQAEAQRLRVTTMPLLATFAEGDVVSSSLEPGTWARLLGCRVSNAVTGDLDIGNGTEPAGVVATSTPSPEALSSDIAYAPTDLPEEQIAQGDLDEHGVIAQLRDIMRGEQSTWRAAFDRLIEAQPETENTARCVVGWLRYLAFERKNKGRRIREGTVRNYRGLLANRLLQHLPPDLRWIDAEELFDAYADVLDSRSSPGQASRIRVALASFHQYVQSHEIQDLPRVPLGGGEQGNYAISSRIISHAEFAYGLTLIQNDRLVFKTEALREQTAAFWILAFRLGMRRKEILGLQVRDVHGPLVYVRKNAWRELKTTNAHRALPFGVVPAAERAFVSTLTTGRRPDDFLFFKDAPTRTTMETHPLVARINDLLERVSGDRHLHPHNLRHSTATLFLLGSLAPDLGLDAHPYFAPWMQAALAPAAAMESVIAGELHRKGGRGSALAMTMGHGSELTTYEHYVHCLDLLLFLACTRERFTKRHGRGMSARIGLDRSMVAALLEYAPTTRLGAWDAKALIGAIAARHPMEVTRLASREGTAPTILPGDAKTARPPCPKLQDLRALARADQMRGYPRKQSELDCANAVLDQFRKLTADQWRAFEELLDRWHRAQMKDPDWASMDAKSAHAWVAAITSLALTVRIDVLHVTRSGRNRKVKSPLARPMEPKSYRGHGVYWIRFADPHAKRRRGRRKTDRVRSREQATVTWVLQAMRRMHPDATTGPQLNLF
ncbi:MAG TPA: tyrosine-type recombinase/integrase [Rhodanobacteraceae bacterium]